MTTERTTRVGAPVLRTALVPSLVAGLICAGVALVAAGWAGVYGALIGSGLVVGFFGLGRLALTVLRNVTPEIFLVFGLLTYALQVVVLLAVFAGFRRHEQWSETVSTGALGGTIIVCTVVWSVGLVVAARRDRTPLYDLGGERR